MEQVNCNVNNVFFITLCCCMTSWGYINKIMMKVFFWSYYSILIGLSSFDNRLCSPHSDIDKCSYHFNVVLCFSHWDSGLYTSQCHNGMCSSYYNVWICHWECDVAICELHCNESIYLSHWDNMAILITLQHLFMFVTLRWERYVHHIEIFVYVLQIETSICVRHILMLLYMVDCNVTRFDTFWNLEMCFRLWC